MASTFFDCATFCNAAAHLWHAPHFFYMDEEKINVIDLDVVDMGTLSTVTLTSPTYDKDVWKCLNYEPFHYINSNSFRRVWATTLTSSPGMLLIYTRTADLQERWYTVSFLSGINSEWISSPSGLMAFTVSEMTVRVQNQNWRTFIPSLSPPIEPITKDSVSSTYASAGSASGIVDGSTLNLPYSMPVAATASARALASSIPIAVVSTIPVTCSSSDRVIASCVSATAIPVEYEIQRRVNEKLEEQITEREKQVRDEYEQKLADTVETHAAKMKEEIKKQEQYKRKRNKDIADAQRKGVAAGSAKVDALTFELEKKKSELTQRESEITQRDISIGKLKLQTHSMTGSVTSKAPLVDFYKDLITTVYKQYEQRRDLLQNKLVDLKKKQKKKPKKIAAAASSTHDPTAPDGFVFKDQNDQWAVIQLSSHVGSVLLRSWQNDPDNTVVTYSFNSNAYSGTKTATGFDQINTNTNVMRQIKPYYGSPPSNNKDSDSKNDDDSSDDECMSKSKITKESINDTLMFGESCAYLDLHKLYIEIDTLFDIHGANTPDLKLLNMSHDLTSDPNIVQLAKLAELHSSFSHKYKYVNNNGQTRSSLWLKPYFVREWMSNGIKEQYEYARITFHGSDDMCYKTISGPDATFKLALSGKHFNAYGPGVYQGLSDELATSYNDISTNPKGTMIICLLLMPKVINDSLHRISSQYKAGANYTSYFLSSGASVKHHFTSHHNAVVAANDTLTLPIGLVYPVS